MCLIAIAGKGSDKTSDFFLNSLRGAATIYDDGFGYALKTKTRVYFSKAYFSIEPLIKAISSQGLTDEDELIVHLRAATSGDKSGANTHPFVINTVYPDAADAMAQQTVHPLMFHNGVFSHFVGNDDKSDTHNFANKFMKIPGIWNLLKNDKEKFLELFRGLIGHSKLAFIGASINEIILIGDFIKDGNYLFSNGVYKTPAPIKVITTNSSTTNSKVADRVNLDDQISTKDIKLTKENCKEFYYKAICDVSGGGALIKKGCKYVVTKYLTSLNDGKDRFLLQSVENSAEYRNLQFSALENAFILIPKLEFKKTYVDYLKLKKKIEPTKSSIKKIFNKTINYSCRAQQPNTIKYKYGKDEELSLDYRAVLLFLEDNKKYINAYKLKDMIEALDINKSKKEVIELPASCDC